jgi:hypothetical protein
MSFKENNITRHWWLMPVILAIQEAEIRKIKVRAVLKTPSRENRSQ